MSMRIKEGSLIYHQTALCNLQSIIKYGLLSRAEIERNCMPFEDVADPDIIEGRFETGLNKYVPFHFHPRTMFDYKIRYNHPESTFIFLCMYRDRAQKLGAAILPAHPLSNMKPELYEYSKGFDKIDWDTMELTKGNVGYNSQVRMAECLLEQRVDISNISIIYVKDIVDKEYVDSLLNTNRVFHIKVYIGDKFFGSQMNGVEY